MDSARPTIFITGYAKLPNTITAHKLYEVIAIGAEVAPDTGEIVDVDCTLATETARRFVNNLARGYRLNEGIDGLVGRLEERYFGSARKALIMAFRIIHDKYLSYQQGLPFSAIGDKK